MVLRTNILGTVETALEAAATFSGVSCIQDDGTKINLIEEQLRTVGSVLVIPPILRFSPREQAAGAAIGDVSFFIRLMVNPTVNSALTTPRVFETMRAAIIETVLALSADDNGDRYRLISDELSEFDPGLLAADVTFEKGCHVNPAT